MLNTTGVSNSYNHGVKISNWNEDKQLSELKLAEFLKRKQNGELLVSQVQAHLNSSLAEVPLTESKDGYLHYGDSVMLFSVATEAVLSIDTSNQFDAYEDKKIITTSSLTQGHVARNVFIILPVDGKDKMGDTVKLGSNIRLQANPALGTELYLFSQPLSATNCSKKSRQQEVAGTRSTNFDTVWIPAFKDVNQRFEMEGQPVPANAEICLMHAQTRQALYSSPKFAVHNDFGKEYEVSAATDMSTGKAQGLYQELLGQTTADISLRVEQKSNHWAFLTSK